MCDQHTGCWTPCLRPQSLTYALALLRHWRGTDTDLLALIDVDEFIVIEEPDTTMQASSATPSLRPVALFFACAESSAHPGASHLHSGVGVFCCIFPDAVTLRERKRCLFLVGGP